MTITVQVNYTGPCYLQGVPAIELPYRMVGPLVRYLEQFYMPSVSFNTQGMTVEYIL